MDEFFTNSSDPSSQSQTPSKTDLADTQRTSPHWQVNWDIVHSSSDPSSQSSLPFCTWSFGMQVFPSEHWKWFWGQAEQLEYQWFGSKSSVFPNWKRTTHVHRIGLCSPQYHSSTLTVRCNHSYRGKRRNALDTLHRNQSNSLSSCRWHCSSEYILELQIGSQTATEGIL